MKDEDKSEEQHIDALTDSAEPYRGDESTASKLNKSEEDRCRLEARYRSLLDLSHDGIATLASHGEILEANQAFLDILGIGSDEIPGLNLSGFCEVPLEWETIRKMAEDERAVRNLEWKAVTRSGAKKECLLTCSKLAATVGNPSDYQVLLTDETERRRSLELLIQADRMKALGEMAGAMAHNIRNLLQVIVSGTRLALSNLDSGHLSEVKAQLEQVVASLRSAGETARLLNHFASARGERPMRQGRIFDVSDVAGKAVEMRQAWLDANPGRTPDKITLKTSLEPGCTIRGMENDLLEVVVNLLWNAVDAMPRCGEVRLSTWTEARSVFLEMSDNGEGIRQADLAKVFQPFWTTKGLLGTGLGLAGSYGIISRHGGEISVESVERQGTTFQIKLPLAERIVQRSERPKLHQGVDMTCNILVVDDLQPLLSMLESELVKRGHQVFAASSGLEAIEIFRGTEIDIVLCDLAMPEMNGWEVGKAVKQICEEKGTSKTPFVMVTGWGGQIDQLDEIEAGGVDSVLEKPVDIVKLSEVIRELVGDRRSK